MASKKELEALIVLAGKIDPSLQRAMLDAEKRTRTLNKETGLLGNVAKKAFGILTKSAAAGAVGLGAAMVYFGKLGLDLASDLTETQNVVDVTFGKNAEKIDTWSKTMLKSFGLSELSAKKYSSTIGALLKSSDVADENLVSMSQNLTSLAADFASFYNLKPDEAFDKIKSGISGSTEPLKALGIDMSVTALSAYAMSKGITTAFDKMSQADKVMLRHNYLLEKSADAQSDFIRNQDSYANQRRMFTEGLQELSGKIMSATLPAFTELYVRGNELRDTFSDPGKIAQFQEKISGIVNKTIELVPVAVKYTKEFGAVLLSVLDASLTTFNFIRNNWSKIKPLIIGIVGAMLLWKSVTGAIAIYETSMKAAKLATISMTAAQNTLSIAKAKDIAATVYLQGLYAKDAVVKGASIAATWAMTAATGAWTLATTIATAVGSAFAAVIAFITSPIGLVILGVLALAAGIYFLIKYWDNVVVAMKGAWEWFTNLIKKIPDLALVLAGPLAPLLLLIKHFDKVKELASGALGAVKKFFGFGGGDKDDGVSDFPKFARGGFANRPSIFGEAGPEAAIPLKRTPRSLSLLSRTARALGVDGGGNSGSPQFVFAPVIHGGDSSTMGKLKEAADDFFDQADRWLESKRRESFD